MNVDACVQDILKCQPPCLDFLLTLTDSALVNFLLQNCCCNTIVREMPREMFKHVWHFYKWQVEPSLRFGITLNTFATKLSQDIVIDSKFHYKQIQKGSNGHCFCLYLMFCFLFSCIIHIFQNVVPSIVIVPEPNLRNSVELL